MAKQKTYYPKFSTALYRLAQVMGETRQQLINNAGFTAPDVAAFDTLSAALNVATAYFPQHTEAS